MKIDKTKLGLAIRKIRSSQGITQRELAEKSGLTVNYLSLLENGKRGIGLDRLNELAEIFGIPAYVFTILASESGDLTDGDNAHLLEQIQTVTLKAIALCASREDVRR